MSADKGCARFGAPSPSFYDASAARIMKSRQLHVLHRPASVARSAAPPLLFVHGGYVSAACWDVFFLPWFSQRGFDCHALDLSGHGNSEGRHRLDSFGLDDYVDDLRQAARDLPRPPIVIGHSMGTVVVERFLEKESAPAAILLSPVPPTGIFGATLSLAFSNPEFFVHQAQAQRGEMSEESLRSMRRVYYSPETTLADLRRFAPLFQAESRRALFELTMLGFRFAGRRPRLPMLVAGGEVDAVFPHATLSQTAARWQAEVAVIPGAGHTLMLDAHWQVAAERIAHWLEALTRRRAT